MVGGHEVFFLWDVISDTQELSHAIAASVSRLADHNPMLPTTITGLSPEPVVRFSYNPLLKGRRPRSPPSRGRQSSRGSSSLLNAANPSE